MAAAAAILALLSCLLCVSIQASSAAAMAEDPTTTPWPEQFHSVLYMNGSEALSLVDLWYDWPGGRNFNIVQNQLAGQLFYDLEWNNGTSFFYTLDPSSPSCSSAQLPVGILRPNWLAGGTYLGQQRADGFLCNVWAKADFITYYEDVAAKRPGKWVFYSGRSVHVTTIDVGAVLEDAKWQAPVYCFDKMMQQQRQEEEEEEEIESSISPQQSHLMMNLSVRRGLVGL